MLITLITLLHSKLLLLDPDPTMEAPKATVAAINTNARHHRTTGMHPSVHVTVSYETKAKCVAQLDHHDSLFS